MYSYAERALCAMHGTGRSISHVVNVAASGASLSTALYQQALLVQQHIAAAGRHACCGMRRVQLKRSFWTAYMYRRSRQS